MLKNMNLPNKLTMLRIVLVPIFVVFMALPLDLKWPAFVAFGIYLVATITDFVDGMLARKNNQITKFGKIMDPLADKLLVSAGFIMLAGIGVIPAWITVIVVFRDFFVNAFRMFGADKKEDLAAMLSGKLKTVFQMTSVILALFGVAYAGIAATNTMNFLDFISSSNIDLIATLINVLMTISVSATVVTSIWSFVDYFMKFKKDISAEE